MPRPTSDTPSQYKYYPQDSDKPYYPRFDPDCPLPLAVQPTRRYMAQLGIRVLPTLPLPALLNNFAERYLGVRSLSIPKTLQREQPPTRLQDWMPANKSRLRLDKFSDEYFVERRLNGFNPGKLNHVQGEEWQYIVRYDATKYKPKPGGILPEHCEARFVYRDNALYLHSIQYRLEETRRQRDTTETSPITVKPDGDAEKWLKAKSIFRNVEFVFQEIQSHLGRTHMNMDQYAVAFYRNIIHNPIWDLLAPHFEGLLNIDKKGASLIIGNTGFIPRASVLSAENVEEVLVEEIKQLTYHWEPSTQKLNHDVDNNHFGRASEAMWELLGKYVDDFFEKNTTAIEKYWGEIEGMSKDLCGNSIVPDRDQMKINAIQDLKDLCRYVIYHCTFFHSWVNNKQYEDGGDVDYATIGIWDPQSPKEEKMVYERHTYQVRLMWALANVHYNPAIIYGPEKLRELLWEYREQIEPGIPLSWIMMSINI